MADKLISLVNCSRYVRHRDIWDLRWLKQQGAKINSSFIHNKIRDYQITDYHLKLEKMQERLELIIRGKAFFAEMSRFIPSDVLDRTLRKDKFLDFLINEIQFLLSAVQKIVSSEKIENDDFRM